MNTQNPEPARARVAEALLPWLAAGASAGLAVGEVLARRNSEGGFSVAGLVGFCGVASLFFMGLGAMVGLVVRGAGGFAAALRNPVTHARLALPGIAGYAVYTATREFEYSLFDQGILTIVVMVLTIALVRRHAAGAWVQPVFTILTLAGTASVVGLGVVAWRVKVESAGSARPEDYRVQREPFQATFTRARLGGRVAVLLFDDIWDRSVDAAAAPSSLTWFQEGSTFPMELPGRAGAERWTTLATGRWAGDHGIRGEACQYAAFLPRIPLNLHAPVLRGFLATLGLLKSTPYSANQRHVKAFWSMVSDAHLTARVAGFPVTFPAESIQGEILTSEAAELDSTDGNNLDLERKLADGLTWPPKLWRSVKDFRDATTLHDAGSHDYAVRNEWVSRWAFRKDDPVMPDVIVCALHFRSGGAVADRSALDQLDRIARRAIAGFGPLDTLILVGLPPDGIAPRREDGTLTQGTLTFYGGPVDIDWSDSPRPTLYSTTLDVAPIVLRLLGLPAGDDFAEDTPLRARAGGPAESRAANGNLTIPRIEESVPRFLPTWETFRAGRLDAYPGLPVR